MELGDVCENTAFWWYWLWSEPGYGNTVNYALYEMGDSLYVEGPPISVLPDQDPTDGWNAYPGLGGFQGDRVAIVMDYNGGPYPAIIGDNAWRNQEAGCSPPPEEAHSFYFEEMTYPGVPLDDDAGYCNIIMKAAFSCEATSVEPASWGTIKSLFR